MWLQSWEEQTLFSAPKWLFPAHWSLYLNKSQFPILPIPTAIILMYIGRYLQYKHPARDSLRGAETMGSERPGMKSLRLLLSLFLPL